MTPKQRATLQVVGIRRLIEAVLDFRSGRIASGENITQLQTDLVEDFTRAWAARTEERADG
jgi:hypothetical protein